jgi:hypothetical protein
VSAEWWSQGARGTAASDKVVGSGGRWAFTDEGFPFSAGARGTSGRMERVIFQHRRRARLILMIFYEGRPTAGPAAPGGTSGDAATETRGGGRQHLPRARQEHHHPPLLSSLLLSSPPPRRPGAHVFPTLWYGETSPPQLPRPW